MELKQPWMFRERELGFLGNGGGGEREREWMEVERERKEMVSGGRGFY